MTLLVLFVIGVLSAALYAALYAAIAGSTPPSLAVRLAIYPILFALYFVAAWLTWKHREHIHSAAYVWLVVIGAVLFRAAVLSGPWPSTTTPGGTSGRAA